VVWSSSERISCHVLSHQIEFLFPTLLCRFWIQRLLNLTTKSLSSTRSSHAYQSIRTVVLRHVLVVTRVVRFVIAAASLETERRGAAWRTCVAAALEPVPQTTPTANRNRHRHRRPIPGRTDTTQLGTREKENNKMPVSPKTASARHPWLLARMRDAPTDGSSESSRCKSSF
jgi:hypothetical protein